MTLPAALTVLHGGFRLRPQVEALVVVCLRPPEVDPDSYLATFQDRAYRSVRTILVLDGSRVIGHAILERPRGHIGRQWRTFVGPDAAEIGAVAVDPAYRGQGIAHLLFEDAAAFAWANHYRPVCVTAPDNHAVLRILAHLAAEPRQPFLAAGHRYQPFVLPAGSQPTQTVAKG